jgi:hypothetical protein
LHYLGIVQLPFDPKLPLIWLVELKPYDPVGAAIVTRRFSQMPNGDVSNIINGVAWPARLASAINYEASIMGGDFGGRGTAAFGTITIATGDALSDDLASLNWDGRDFTVYVGNPGQSWPFDTVFKGQTEAVEATDSLTNVIIRDMGLTLPVQTTLYAGTGSAEAGTDLKNVGKPLCYGSPRNIDPVQINIPSQIWQVHDGQIEGIDAVYDRGVALTAGPDFSTYSALAAWSAVAGTYATSLALGLVRLGSPPDGPVTMDVKGEKNGATSYHTVADIIRRIALTRGGLTSGDLDSAAFTALNTATSSAQASLYVRSGGANIDDLFDQLTASAGAYWTFTAARLLTVGQIAFTTPVATITERDIIQGSLSRQRAPAPVWRLAMGYARAWLVMQKGDINLPSTVSGTVDFSTQVSGAVKPADNATKNVTTTSLSSAPPASPTAGDLWSQTDTNLFKRYNGTTWETYANAYSNTNQLTDGAALGSTATWTGVSGSAKPADNATNDLHIAVTGTCVAVGNNISKPTGAAASWDSSFYSLDSWVGGAFINFTPDTTTISVVVGLNTDPLTDSSYASIDYSWLTNSDGNCYTAVAGAPTLVGAYTTNDVFSVVYNGTSILWYQNGVLKRTVTGLSAGIRYYLDSSFRDPGASVSKVKFGPLSSQNWVDVSGTGKPADNATKNIITYSSTAPATPADGDLWVDTSVSPNLSRVRISGAWQIASSYNTGALANLNTAGTAQIDNNAINNVVVVLPSNYTVSSGSVLTDFAEQLSYTVGGTGKVVIDTETSIYGYGNTSYSFALKRRVHGAGASAYTDTGLVPGAAGSGATSVYFAGDQTASFNVGDYIKMGSSAAGNVIISVSYPYPVLTNTYVTFTSAITWLITDHAFTGNDGYVTIDKWTDVYKYVGSNNNNLRQHMRFVDAPAAGTYDYKVQVGSYTNANTTYLKNNSMAIQEIKK